MSTVFLISDFNSFYCSWDAYDIFFFLYFIYIIIIFNYHRCKYKHLIYFVQIKGLSEKMGTEVDLSVDNIIPYLIEKSEKKFGLFSINYILINCTIKELLEFMRSYEFLSVIMNLLLDLNI